MSLLENLNESQRIAVQYITGPQLVIAGAGSGKTRVLTYKIAYLLQQGLNPWNILALTFTNKAANEMKERIAALVGFDAARRLHMGTFHSVFSRILRVEYKYIGFNSNFTIYDESDSRSLLKAIIKDMNLDDKKYKPASVHSYISMAKNHLIGSATYNSDHSVQERDYNFKMPELGHIFTAYEQRCHSANAMDFDDLLVKTYTLFNDNPEIREKYAQYFQYILVDEYQDTNYAQQSIIRQLSNANNRVCVVGDDAQSIYGFRGANIDNILKFNTIYPEAKLFKLEQNYRSTQRIVQAANSLIKHNNAQIPKDVFSKNAEGDKLIFKPAYSDREEAAIVVKDINRIKCEDKCQYSDFAILYRTNSQSRSFEEELRKNNVPYRIYGGLSFYQRKEIKDIIAYFRLVVNPADEEAIKRVINYPARGIGNTTITKLAAAVQAHTVSFWDVIKEPAHYGLDVNKGTLAKLVGFRELIETFMQGMNDDAFCLGQQIIKDSGIHDDIFKSKDAEDISRQENLEEFLSSLQEFVENRKEEGLENATSLSDFLQEVSLLSDLDSDDASSSKVSLMTIHAAKGLEFPCVFIVGLEENIFPSPMSCNTMREIEEERRLLYVAITRAEKHCILTCAKNRFRYGKMEFDTPSRFIKDIDSNLLDVQGGSNIDSTENYNAGRRYRDYEVNTPYTGSHPWGSEYQGYSGKMQNSRPVASQFRADVKPKVTSPHHAETAADPFSEGFKRRLVQHGGNLRRVSSAMTNGGRALTINNSSTSSSAPVGNLSVGDKIEHQRFGLGVVERVEGTGENTKATVVFENTGTKQLLLKFAKFKKL